MTRLQRMRNRTIQPPKPQHSQHNGKTYKRHNSVTDERFKARIRKGWKPEDAAGRPSTLARKQPNSAFAEVNNKSWERRLLIEDGKK